MIKFNFNSFGKVKLLIGRLSKLTTQIQFGLYRNECKILFDDCEVIAEINILEGILPDEGEYFMLNIDSFHNIIKNIPATSEFSCKWDHSTELELITKARKKSQCNNSIKIRVKPLVFVDNSVSGNIGHDTNTSVHKLIWIMEKISPCFEEVNLSFENNHLRISGKEDEYEFESEILILGKNIGQISVKLHSVTFLQKLWLLEWNNSNICFFIDPISLELHVSSKSNNDEILLMLR